MFLLAGGCSTPAYVPEAWSYYYRRPSNVASSEFQEIRKIVRGPLAGEAAGTTKTVGYLERYIGTLKNSRETYEYHLLLNMAQESVGYYDARGTLYRFVGNGEMEPVVKDELTRALRQYLKLPPATAVTLAKIDPYRE